MKKLLVLLISVVMLQTAFGREGMWIPLLLEKYNLAEMQKMGFKLSAQDIYDVNHASMKDAVVVFGRGCTGELISNDGLLITNHHCGYGQIQSHSSIEHDYLTNGFWAMSRDEELPNPGLTVSFLEYMEDVSDKILAGTEDLTDDQRGLKIKENTQKIIKEAQKEGKFSASVKPLFYGNQYFLYVYKVFRDVRFVGAPPSAIGKFGGDTDNWMWPRHTGDFSLFRVYANKNNEPADYSADNIPYHPKKFFPVSLKGVHPGDFTMVFGNPGRTMEYWPHHEVDITLNQRDPDRIRLRDIKLKIISADMEADPKVRIQYAAKYAGISNSWKKWQGEIGGLNRLDAVNKKMAFENEFKQWAIRSGVWQNQYKQVFDNFDEIYPRYKNYIHAYDYYSEVVFRGVEVFRQAAQVNSLLAALDDNDPEKVDNAKMRLLNSIPAFFKNYNQPTDEKLFVALIPELAEHLDPSFLPAGFAEKINHLSPENLLKKVYRKSVLLNADKLSGILKKGKVKQLKKLRNDPLVKMYSNLVVVSKTKISPVVNSLTAQINNNMKTYMAGLMEMKKGQAFYPDANLTLRVAYGKVEGYEPRDGVKYKHFTTIAGIIEKDNPEIYDYDVPDRLKELYEKKDFGPYEVNGDVPVCFTASNHTTGGNSGSPVVNGNGELIGVNFDRCWEGTMSDIMFDPDRCRNISLDIRYALFIIDKFAGAGYLLDEMEIRE